jgi:hypothetical protein
VAHAAAVVVQRFGSALNLNVHAHALVSDGVWAEPRHPGSAPRWVPLRLDDSDVLAVSAEVAGRCRALLLERGWLTAGPDGEDELAPVEADGVDDGRQLELALANASVGMRIATGQRAGREVRRRKVDHEPWPKSKKRLQAAVSGFDVEAGVRVPARDRRLLERVSRYLLRPPLAMERLSLRPDKLYEYGLRRPWSDGTIAVVLSPMELLEKLAALVPKPRVHLIRYFGIFAPNHRWRKAILPTAKEGLDEVERRTRPRWGWAPDGGLVPAIGHIPWAQLLQRIWKVDILRCVRCGSKRLLLQVVEPAAIDAILTNLNLPRHCPILTAARGPPDGDDSC